MSLINRKIKVMIVVPSIDVGGAERFICLLANHLDRSKMEVRLVVTGSPETIYELRPDLDFHSFSEDNARNALFKIRRMMKQLKPDVVFSTLCYFNVLLATFRQLFPKNIVFVGRESEILKKKLENEKSKIYSFFYKHLARYFLPNLDVLICQSKGMQASLDELGIYHPCLLYTSPSPRDATLSRMPSSA